MRSWIYVMGGAPATDERNFKRLRASRAKLETSIELSEFKRLVREQFSILKLDREQALKTLPALLAGQSSSDIDAHIKNLEHVFAASGELSEHAAERFVQVKALFDQARPKESAPKDVAAPKASAASTKASVKKTAKSKPVAKKPAPSKAKAAVTDAQVENPVVTKAVVKQGSEVNKKEAVKASSATDEQAVKAVSSPPTADESEKTAEVKKPAADITQRKTPRKR